MSGFGGFAPLPLRLGGSATEGWTSPQHARFCADLRATSLTAPFSWLVYTVSGAVVTIDDYIGMDGVYLSSPPVTPTFVSGQTILTYGNRAEDEYDVSEPIAFRGAVAGVAFAGSRKAVAEIIAPNVIGVKLYTFSGTAVEGTGCVVAW